MENFSYFNPTHIHFGKGQIAALAKQVPKDQKVLILYGGGSIKANGVLDQVHAALSEHQYIEFGGIEANPQFETLMKAVALARKEGVGFLLAVGGGSVIDGSKLVASAACFEGDDVWEELVIQRKYSGRAIPLGCVLTLPATGTESNIYSVISHAGKQLKRSIADPATHPVFAILDPEVTYSLPKHQIANGVVDAFVHVIERYLTYPTGALVQEYCAEGIMQALIGIGEQAVNTTDYNARATYMWAANQAHNDVVGLGMPQDWSTHIIGHELTVLYGLDHALSLAVILPHNMQICRESKRGKLLQYATRVWGIREGSDDEKIDAAIARTAAFFESVGLKTHLSALGIGMDAVEKVVARLQAQGFTALGERGAVTPDVVRQILQLSVQVV